MAGFHLLQLIGAFIRWATTGFQGDLAKIYYGDKEDSGKNDWKNFWFGFISISISVVSVWLFKFAIDVWKQNFNFFEIIKK